MYRYSEILMCKPLLIYLCKPQIFKNCFVISDVGCTCDSVCKLAAIVGLCHKAVIILNMYFFCFSEPFTSFDCSVQFVQNNSKNKAHTYCHFNELGK